MSQRAPTVIRYERQDLMVRVTLKHVTNHELREVLIGLWCRLDADDRLDHLKAIQLYLRDPGAWLSNTARAIKMAGEGSTQGIDLAALAARGEKVRP